MFDAFEAKYNQYTTDLEAKYSETKVISILENLSSSLDKLITKTDLSAKNRDYISFLYNINRQKIDQLQTPKVQDGANLQKVKEYKYIIALKAQSERKETQPEYISSLIQSGKKIYNTNDIYEFYDESKAQINRVSFRTFYKISSEVIPLLKQMDGIIVSPKEGEYIFVTESSFEKKYPFSSFYTDQSIKGRFLDLGKKYFLEWNTYYTYDFTQYQVFADSYWFYDSTFVANWVNKDSIAFLRDNEWKFWYIITYQKVKLISQDLLAWVTNKDSFLATVADDKKYLFWDTDDTFRNLKNVISKLVSNQDSKEEKIKKIYAWILENIQYSRSFQIEDKTIFSWIETFINHEWVCDGYAKLMEYMLLYAGVDNGEVIRGDVIDAQDFPYIWHAWIKIGEDYYDPTFDDPVGLSSTLTFNQYKYYKLPRDLLYTNRFDYKDTPESLKTATIEQRQDLIKRNLSNLVSKYEKENYLLLKPFIFRKTNGIEYNEKISINTLKKMVPLIEQINNSSIAMNWQKRSIRKLSYLYYLVDNPQDIEIILQTVNYEVKNLSVIKTPTGEYRVAYNITIE